MRFFNKSLLVLTLSVISTITSAADITDTYSTGDALTATTLNNIKSAVNSKQDRVTGACSPGESIGAINADGTVTCEVDDDTVYTDAEALNAVSSTLSAIKSVIVNGVGIFSDVNGIVSPSTLASITVTPPANGNIRVTASGRVGSYLGPNSSRSTTITLRKVGIALDTDFSDHIFSNGLDAGIYQKGTVYMNIVESVSANTPVTFEVRSGNQTNSTGFSYSGKLTATFFPNALP